MPTPLRDLIARQAAAGLILAGFALGIASAQTAALTVVSFGRADQDALTRAAFNPFTKATGIEISSISYDGAATELEQMVSAGAPTWDVIQVESRTLHLGCANGLFEKLDRRRLGATADLIPGALSDCGAGLFAWSMALVYSGRDGAAPQSWADFWNVRKFPGKRGLRRSAKYTLEIALLADGVPPADVYRTLATPAGVDRAFRKLDRIKADTYWWEAAAQPGALMAAGRIAMSAGYALWFDPEQPSNRNFHVAWDQSLYDIDSLAVPKGAAHQDEAYRFIAYALAPERQKALAELVPYGPVNRKALDLIKPALAQSLPTAPGTLARALRIDTGFWVRHGEALEKRFDQWAPVICRQQTDDDEEYEEQSDCQDIRGLMRVHNKAAARPADSSGAGAPTRP